MDDWAHIGTLKSFTKQQEIQKDIEKCHEVISDCLTKFTVCLHFRHNTLLSYSSPQLASHISIHDWQQEYAMNTQRDHAEVVEYLSEIQNSQKITNDALSVQGTQLTELMSMMQGVSNFN
jgi:hypothetical protein